MAGIYIHIPFCKQACHYCDFHFSTSMKTKGEVLWGIMQEIKTRAKELDGEIVESIYFGGGTPSILASAELEEILQTIRGHFSVDTDCEITLECNPDDLNEDKLVAFKKIGINRLSIGIQSFEDEHLTFMNRAHNSEEALESVKMAQDAGFDNITIDLIYGIPKMSLESWQKNIDTAMKMGVQHISSYCLTVEKGTALDHFVKTGKVVPVSNEMEAKQFDTLFLSLKKCGFEQYEVSNFAKPGYISRHNSSYWKGKKYLGFGPGAHSFDGETRRWNVSNNVKYAKAMRNAELVYDSELLTQENRINEYLMTGLRTKWGVDLKYLLDTLGYIMTPENSAIIQNLLEQEEAINNNSNLVLTPKGLLKADKIASDLFVI